MSGYFNSHFSLLHKLQIRIQYQLKLSTNIDVLSSIKLSFTIVVVSTTFSTRAATRRWLTLAVGSVVADYGAMYLVPMKHLDSLFCYFPPESREKRTNSLRHLAIKTTTTIITTAATTTTAAVVNHTKSMFLSAKLCLRSGDSREIYPIRLG